MSTVMLCSYPPSVPLIGGSTRAAPARWGAVREEREGCGGDCATSSRWLCFSSLCVPSSVGSPLTDPPPPVLLFNWAFGSKLGTLHWVQTPLTYNSLRKTGKHCIWTHNKDCRTQTRNCGDSLRRRTGYLRFWLLLLRVWIFLLGRCLLSI